MRSARRSKQAYKEARWLVPRRGGGVCREDTRISHISPYRPHPLIPSSPHPFHPRIPLSPHPFIPATRPASVGLTAPPRPGTTPP